MVRNSFERWALALLGLTLLVVLWGAFVRVTGSGAGCADHWPLCNGELVPRSPRVETLIELTHRVTSALSGLLSLWVTWLAFRRFAAGSPVRGAALAQLVLMLVEGAIGALLVKKRLVADDSSAARAYVVGAHLVNTFLLLGAQALTYLLARDPRPLALRAQVKRALWLGLLAVMLLLLGASGAVTALGDTLFPATSLGAGLAHDLARDAHFLVRLRVYHPLLALAAGAVLVYAAQSLRSDSRDPGVRLAAHVVSALYGVQTLIGLANLWWLAPAPVQVLHLLFAELTWLALVVLAVLALQRAR